ncbi:MAG: octaprenyl diphosphate synthase [Gammaproteobacteria bacterium]|nr:MAG: octaprenyl diphosphate synthase [Gammaproteobacteria bacterium]RLA24055.1 MAG: octaprenyl diphosphate synthase [Gammaproteobacteria bacterium]
MANANQNSASNIDFSSIKSLMAEENSAVDQLIVHELKSDVVLINQIGQYIVNSGGKRLRPLLVLLAAESLNYKGTHHHILAAVIEFIHTATLLHDDVVDSSDLRRGKETANAIWGNAASVLVGDFLYSRAFEMMVRVQSMRVMDILSHTTNAIAEGEVLQLLNVNDPDTTEARYREVIKRKTAILFSAATELGAVIAEAEEQHIKALAKYGMHLGTAFQLVDDVLDYTANAEELGKNIGDDLAEGKPTLPLIYAINNGSIEQANFLKNAIKEGDGEAFNEVFEIVKSTGAIAYTENCAKEEAEMAARSINNLPDSPYKEALITLAEFSVQRSY